ncbi:MAG TPA: shikimate dehydrogenase [Gemmatimonadaceae bacterium]|nr:shikimate dehydrogenase [Gemmatimonadaceae bacterium]
MNPRPTRLVLLGHPVAHSLSPRMQGAALRAAGIDVEYQALDVPPHDLARVLAELASAGAAGNVTVPHKAAVAAECARLEPLAQRTGAVNTFWTEQGRLVGANTDVAGFDAAVRDLLGALPTGIPVAVVGAGGGAAGVLAAIERWGDCEVRLHNRTAERAHALARRFQDLAVVAASVDAGLRGASLVVNATSVGLYDDALPFDIRHLEPGSAVVDLVYRPGDTELVRQARAAGHRAAGGLAMLVGQGAASFAQWFGVDPDRRVMWKAVEPTRPG